MLLRHRPVDALVLMGEVYWHFALIRQIAGPTKTSNPEPFVSELGGMLIDVPPCLPIAPKIKPVLSRFFFIW